MWHFVEDSKYRAETISIVQSFADVMLPGDSISGTPTISITVSSGIDPTPSTILYEGVSVTNGNTVEQRFRLGIIGVIYCITFTIVTVMGETLEKECYLAILPQEGFAIPTFLPLYESTQLYPYQINPEYIQGSTILTGGYLKNLLYAIPPEDIQGLTILTGGTLTLVVITYNIPHEDIQGATVLQGGLLTYQNNIPYAIPHEDIKGKTLLISGTLFGGSILYTCPHEDIQGHTILTGGTLV